MGIFFNLNGKLIRRETPALRVDNRAFRYGDGFFETMRMEAGNILRWKFHAERFLNSMALLRYPTPEYYSPDFFMQEISDLAKANNLSMAARVRLTIFRGNGSLKENFGVMPEYIIEIDPLDHSPGEWQAKGLSIGIFPDVQKYCDKYAQLKSNNFLPYSLASIFAAENKWHDAILLNNHGRICDSTIANVFTIKDGKVYTPPLAEGCIAGTFRKYLINRLPLLGMEVIEMPLHESDLLEADEIFLTNAIQEIRWVKEFGGREYGPGGALGIYSLLKTTI